MESLVHYEPGSKASKEIADPAIEVATDAIVRLDTPLSAGCPAHLEVSTLAPLRSPSAPEPVRVVTTRSPPHHHP